MANGIQAARISDQAAYLPTNVIRSDEAYDSFERYRDRVYSLAFWMTDNELQAEELQRSVFVRVFAKTDQPTDEVVDRALISELRKTKRIGSLTLTAKAVDEVVSIRKNTLRIHLERAIVALPATERLIYCMHDAEGCSHRRLAAYLDITEADSQRALHNARLRIRELVSQMN